MSSSSALNWLKIKALRIAAAYHGWRWHRVQAQIVRQYGLDCDELAARRTHHMLMYTQLQSIADLKERKPATLACCSCSPGAMSDCSACEGNA